MLLSAITARSSKSPRGLSPAPVVPSLCTRSGTNRPRWARTATRRTATASPGSASRRPPFSAEREHDRRGEERPEREAEVPADREERHAACTQVPAHVVRELRGLRVVGGHAQPGDEDGDEHKRVGGRHRREGHADSRYGDSDREEPVAALRVRDEPKKRLHDRRADRRGENQSGRHRIGKVEPLDEEGQEGSERALRQVGCQMARRERRHPFPVHAGSHAARIAAPNRANERARGARSARGRAATGRRRSSVGSPPEPQPSHRREGARAHAEAPQEHLGGPLLGEGAHQGKGWAERVVLRS